MSKYISADEMLEYLDLMYEHQDDKDEPYNIGVLGATNYIKHKAPSIVIVRCGECKCGLRTNFIKEPYLMCEQWSDDGNARTVRPNDFCSYGDRVTNTTVEDKPTPIRDYMVHGEMKGADDE